jgi:hypothetical protein
MLAADDRDAIAALHGGTWRPDPDDDGVVLRADAVEA